MSTCTEDITKQLSASEFESLRKSFEAIDTNGDGFIDASELKELFQNTQHYNLSNDDIVDALKEVDQDKNGVIDFYEFVGHTMKLQRDANDEICRKAFEMFDKDKNGSIDASEVKFLMRMMGVRVRGRNINEFMKRYDVDSEGSISYEEFKIYYDQCIAPSM